MKIVIATALIVLLSTLPGQCRIGETLAELTTRFGEGRENSQKIRLPGHDQYYFEKDGIGVQCVMSDDKCVMEVFHRIGSKITEQDIHEILRTEADGHGWGLIKPDRWNRSDNQLTAYREHGHADMFFIEDIAAMKANGKYTKGKPGF
jgi:hypothetical protein